MTIERTDTHGKGLKPGQYTFTIAENPVKKKWDGGSVYYEWFFETVKDGELKEHKENIPVWKLAPLLRVLDAKEIEPEVFEWDREGVKGLQFDGEIIMEWNKEKTKSYARISNHRRIGTSEGKPKPVDDDSIPF